MPPKMPLDRNAAMAIALGLLALACAGCGQKGALYLPDRQPQAVPASPDAPGTQATPDAGSTAAAKDRKKPGQE